MFCKLVRSVACEKAAGDRRSRISGLRRVSSLKHLHFLPHLCQLEALGHAVGLLVCVELSGAVAVLRYLFASSRNSVATMSPVFHAES